MKKIVSLFLALVMCLALAPCAFAAETADKFTDVPADAWYKSELDYAVFNGYISGTSATTFSPEASVTRGQFVTLLGRLADCLNDLEWQANGIIRNRFTDVPADAYYALYVVWALGGRLVNGTSDTTFSPDASVTVEQMGTIVANYLNNKKLAVGYDDVTPAGVYKDAALISQYARDSMELMRKLDLLVVDGNGNVNPQKPVTRAECAVTIVRLAKFLGRGVVPIVTSKCATAEEAAKKVHDTLWASGVITDTMTQKEKAKVYYDWFIPACSYSISGRNIFNAYGALVEGKAACEGITKGYNLLLATEGIECSMITSDEANHAWTAATLDGVLYHIDATNGWPDIYGVSDSGYLDFCVSPEQAWEIINLMSGGAS